MQVTKKLIKPACFLTAFSTIWFGPGNILGRTSYDEEKIHIALGIIVSLIILAFRLTPKHPGEIKSPETMSKKKQITLLRAQLRYQWHLIKEKTPFDEKYAPIKLLIGQNGTGCSSLMQNLCKIQPETNLPFACEWFHDKNSIICKISPEIIPSISAQHSKHLFQVIRKFLEKKSKQNNLNTAYLTVSVNNIMQSEVTKHMDAYNYTLSALTSKEKSVPVKLIITKCDQIAGFVPYFEHSDQHTKENNLELKFNNFSDIEFNQEYSNMVEYLNAQMIRRLHTETQYYRRILIKDFPIQIEKLRPMILGNLQHLIQNEAWTITGLNFTSATQNGSYIDLINQKIGMQDAIGTEKLMLASQRYFCENLFNSPPLVYKARISTVLTETWGQVIIGLLGLTFIMILNQAWWLQRFTDIKNFQISKLEKPKILLARDEALWQTQRLQSGLATWLTSNPVPKYFKHEKSINNSKNQITSMLVKSIQKTSKNCKNNIYACLENNWSSFISTHEISQRINWIKQHQDLFKDFKLNSNNLQTVRNELVNKAISENFSAEHQITWLANLIDTIQHNRILLPEYRKHELSIQLALQNPSNLIKLQQMLFALENMHDSNKIFKYLKNYQKLNQAEIPQQLIDLEHNIYEKIKPIIQEHINQVWQQSIYKYFQQNLANKYPFKIDAKEDAELQAVRKLFRMKEFFINYYSPAAKKINLTINNSNLAEINAAEKFLGEMLQLRFSLAPSHKLNSDINVAELNIGGSIHTLDKNSIPMFTWPLAGYDDTVSIWLQNKAGKMSMASRHGPWGIFRLINISGKFMPGQRSSMLQFRLDEQTVPLKLDFARPWAKLNIQIPEKLL